MGDRGEQGIVNKQNSPYLYMSINVWCIKLIHKEMEMLQNANRNIEQKQGQRRYITDRIEIEIQNGNLLHKEIKKWKNAKIEIENKYKIKINDMKIKLM